MATRKRRSRRRGGFVHEALRAAGVPTRAEVAAAAGRKTGTAARGAARATRRGAARATRRGAAGAASGIGVAVIATGVAAARGTRAAAGAAQRRAETRWARRTYHSAVPVRPVSRGPVPATPVRTTPDTAPVDLDGRPIPPGNGLGYLRDGGVLAATVAAQMDHQTTASNRPADNPTTKESTVTDTTTAAPKAASSGAAGIVEAPSNVGELCAALDGLARSIQSLAARTAEFGDLLDADTELDRRVVTSVIRISEALETAGLEVSSTKRTLQRVYSGSLEDMNSGARAVRKPRFFQAT